MLNEDGRITSSIDPYVATLVAHTKPISGDLVKNSQELVNNTIFENITTDELKEKLKDHNLVLRSSHPQALENLLKNLSRIR